MRCVVKLSTLRKKNWWLCRLDGSECPNQKRRRVPPTVQHSAIFTMSLQWMPFVDQAA